MIFLAKSTTVVAYDQKMSIEEIKHKLQTKNKALNIFDRRNLQNKFKYFLFCI